MAWWARWKRGLTSRRPSTGPKCRRTLACDRLSSSCVTATRATNCAGATPISNATSTNSAVAQQVVQQMVAVVRPHRHLALAVVQRVQLPPPGVAVLGAVQQVVHRVEDHQVEQEADPGDVGDAGPGAVELQGRPAGHAQHAEEVVPQRLEREEQQHAEEAQAVQQGVDHVHAHGSAVGHGFHRAPAFQRAEDRQHDARSAAGPPAASRWRGSRLPAGCPGPGRTAAAAPRARTALLGVAEKRRSRCPCRRPARAQRGVAAAAP